jgi:hypothetical protein
MRWCTGFSRLKLRKMQDLLELRPPKGGTPTKALKTNLLIYNEWDEIGYSSVESQGSLDIVPIHQ